MEASLEKIFIEEKEEGMDDAAWSAETMKDTFCYILDKAVIDGEEEYKALITEEYISGLLSTIGQIRESLEALEKKIEKVSYLDTF